jgi:hypothetical protein
MVVYLSLIPSSNDTPSFQTQSTKPFAFNKLTLVHAGDFGSCTSLAVQTRQVGRLPQSPLMFTIFFIIPNVTVEVSLLNYNWNCLQSSRASLFASFPFIQDKKLYVFFMKR